MDGQLSKFFDVIAGQPLHPLVVHFAIALSPVIGVMVFWQLARGRRNLWGKLAVWAGVNLVLLVYAVLSGGVLAERLSGEGEGPELHETYGGLTAILAAVMFLLLLVIRAWDGKRRRSWQWVRMVVVALLAVNSLGLISFAALSAISGGQAVWHEEIVNTNP